jgi:hypothetical protein
VHLDNAVEQKQSVTKDEPMKNKKTKKQKKTNTKQTQNKKWQQFNHLIIQPSNHLPLTRWQLTSDDDHARFFSFRMHSFRLHSLLFHATAVQDFFGFVLANLIRLVHFQRTASDRVWLVQTTAPARWLFQNKSVYQRVGSREKKKKKEKRTISGHRRTP